MSTVDRLSRRQLLILGTPLLTFAAYKSVGAVDTPLLNPEEKDAKAVKYVEDATKAQRATPESTCANCAVYQGKAGAPTGPCQIFPGKLVKAAGWCSSWAPQI
jgi:High potential iron-sulfur protein